MPLLPIICFGFSQVSAKIESMISGLGVSRLGQGYPPGVRAAIFNCVSLPGSAYAGLACVPSYYDINSSDDRVSPRTRSLQVSWTPFWLRRSTVVAPLPASQLLSLKEEERRIFWSRKEVIGGSEASPIRILAKNMITYL